MSAPGLAGLEGEALVRADELLGQASHDVAKYMSMTARNARPEALARGGEQLDWLRADLEQTGASGAAWDLWAPLSAELSGLAADPTLAAIDEAMAALAQLFARLAAEPALAPEVASRAVTVADQITALRRAVRQRRLEVGQ